MGSDPSHFHPPPAPSPSDLHERQLTDLVLDVVGHAGHVVQQPQRLVHALLDDAQVGQHLSVGRHKSASPRAGERARSGGRRGATYLGSDLRRLLGVHHAHVLKVLEGVLPVLLLGAHVLLQQAEDVTGLKRDGGTR